MRTSTVPIARGEDLVDRDAEVLLAREEQHRDLVADLEAEVLGDARADERLVAVADHPAFVDGGLVVVGVAAVGRHADLQEVAHVLEVDAEGARVGDRGEQRVARDRLDALHRARGGPRSGRWPGSG